MTRAWNIAVLHYRRISSLTNSVRASSRPLFRRITELVEDPYLRAMRDTVEPWERLRIDASRRRIEHSTPGSGEHAPVTASPAPNQCPGNG